MNKYKHANIRDSQQLFSLIRPKILSAREDSEHALQYS